jgi:hypothetical protein
VQPFNHAVQSLRLTVQSPEKFMNKNAVCVVFWQGRLAI